MELFLNEYQAGGHVYNSFTLGRGSFLRQYILIERIYAKELLFNPAYLSFYLSLYFQFLDFHAVCLKLTPEG